MRIPVIDLTEALKPGQSRRLRAAAQIKLAAETSGFFYVSNHGVPMTVVDRQFEAAAEFFSLPSSVKESVAMRESSAMRGYERIGSQTLDESARADLKECFQCGRDYAAAHPYVVKKYAPYGLNQWPGKLPCFELACREYLAAMEGLAQRILQLLALSLELPEDYFDRFNTYPSDILRLLRYPPQPATADALTFGAGAHTDWGALTILAQDTNGGLEVRMPDGEWVPAPPIPETFVVNLGDMIPRWTNGRYKSNFHRVINANRSGRHRFSVAFFCDLDYEALIQPLAGFQDVHQPLWNAPCTVGEHMDEMYRKTYAQA